VIVLDACAAVEIFSDPAAPLSAEIRKRVSGQRLIVPAHFDFEVAHTIRRLWIGRKIDQEVAATAVSQLTVLAADRVPLADLLPRAWELRHNAYVGDAFYLALAEDLEIPLVTIDAKMSGVPGARCEVDCVTIRPNRR
jgi:predicted nucleic acid-binding protein